jgi:hypothetical protein
MVEPLTAILSLILFINYITLSAHVYNDLGIGTIILFTILFYLLLLLIIIIIIEIIGFILWLV